VLGRSFGEGQLWINSVVQVTLSSERCTPTERDVTNSPSARPTLGYGIGRSRGVRSLALYGTIAASLTQHTEPASNFVGRAPSAR
jgi:hypothetical protein